MRARRKRWPLCHVSTPWIAGRLRSATRNRHSYGQRDLAAAVGNRTAFSSPTAAVSSACPPAEAAMFRHLYVALVVAAVSLSAAAEVPPEKNPTYTRIKAHLDAVPAIDTHDHLWPFEKLPGNVET